jgi:hypothetical protein
MTARRPQQWRTRIALWQRRCTFVFVFYAPVLAGVNFAWEIGQLPLYTIWYESAVGEIAFAVMHCTAGDVMIGSASLLLALAFVGRSDSPLRQRPRVLWTAVLCGVAYTIVSEWLNTSVRATWSYTASMPIVPLIGTGGAPLLQWLVLPPVAHVLALRRYRRNAAV